MPQPSAASALTTKSGRTISDGYGVPLDQFAKHRFVRFLRNVETRKGVSVEFVFNTLDGPVSEIIASQTLCAPARLKSEMSDLGLSNLIDTMEWAQLFVNQHRRADFVTRLGKWRDNVLVNCFGEFGDLSAGASVTFDRGSPLYIGSRSAGDLSTYLERVGKLLKASSVLTVLYCFGLWPALADRLGKVGGISAGLTGKSSRGKTNGQRLVRSLISSAEKTDLDSFNITPGFADVMLSPYGGAVLNLSDLKDADEQGKNLAQFIRRLVFAIADGKRRRRLEHAGANRSDPGGYIGALMSYEHSFQDMFEKHSQKLEVGEAVRVIDLEINGPCGIFDGLTDPRQSERAASYLEQTIEKNYGLVMPIWGSFLAENPVDELQTRFEKERKRFLDDYHELTPAGRRICAEFANWYATGVLAQEEGLLPVDEEVLRMSLATFFQQQVERLRTEKTDPNTVVRAVKAALLREDDFPLAWRGVVLDDDDANTKGFFRDEDDGRHLYVHRDYLEKVAEDPTILNTRVLGPAVTAKALRASQDRYVVKVAQSGVGRAWCLDFKYWALKEWLAGLV